MRAIDAIPDAELRGKRVIVRSDFNVPLSKSGDVLDMYRLKRGWSTIKYLQERGARTVVISHIGRDPGETLEPVARALKLYAPVVYIPDLTGVPAQQAVAAMRDGDILLLENLRRDPREVANDVSLAQDLAAFADLYVGDAFAAAHREHASIVGIPKILPHVAGFLMREEVEELSRAITPERPALAILGGAKFETKEPLVKKLLDSYDHMFLTGALANDVFKVRGLPIGRSLISEHLPDEGVLSHPHFLAPIDVTVERLDKQARTKKPEDVVDEDKIVDIGPETVQMLAPYIAEAKFILWNGPTGLYEGGYVEWTHAIAKMIEESSATKIVGGGDTIAVLEETGAHTDKLGFLSTGGGAMLEFLINSGHLPGVDVLES
jgi:3-phosphoglycerate kinase